MTRRRKPDDSAPAPGRFAYDGLERVLHEKARLGILVSLTTRPDGLTFGELKQLCSLTDGNLSRHLDALAEEKLVAIHKGFQGRRPQTRVTMTAGGRRRFLAYLAELERVVRDALPQADASPSPRPGLAPG
jgi:DNA-binding transcriptional ArsR family regulator